MRETFISILALLAVARPSMCSEIGKDGFNFYKDYLRGRSEDAGGEGPSEDRVIYFYRTPLALPLSVMPALEQEYKKRTGNAYKNHMLGKEMINGEDKRSSKTALSRLMQGKHPYETDTLATRDIAGLLNY